MMHYQRAAGEKTGPFPAGHGETGYIIRRFLALAHLKVLFPYLAAALLLVVVAVGGGRELRHHIHAIETWIMILGPWGLLAFIGLFILTTSFFVPDTVLCLIAGSLFGLGRGVILVTAGSLLAAILQYMLSREFLREGIQRRLSSRPALAAIQQNVILNEFRLQFLLRLTPMNPAIINYLLGAAGVRFTGFMLAFPALIPNLAVEVYFGYVLRHAVQLAGRRSAGVHDIVIIGGVVVCIVVMVLISRMARQAIIKSMAENEGPRQIE
jgi:uncharacterized membrane protein YdjX (TVP38/TMEM64 family)